MAELGQEVLGSTGYFFCAFFVCLLQAGTCISYIYTFSLFFNKAFCFANLKYLCGNKEITTICSLILIIPLCLIKSIGGYTKYNLLANILVTFSLLVIFSYSIEILSEKGIPISFGICVFAYETVGIIFEIRNSMEEPIHFQNLLKRQFIITTILFIIFPTICTLSFGFALEDLVLFNLPLERVVFFMVYVFYLIIIAIGFTFQLFPINIIAEIEVDDYVKNNKKEGECVNKKIKNIMKYLARIIIVLLLTFITSIIPNYSAFLGFVGSLGSTVISFILPVILYYKFFENERETDRFSFWKKFLHFLLIIEGVVGGGIGLFSSVKKMIEG